MRKRLSIISNIIYLNRILFIGSLYELLQKAFFYRVVWLKVCFSLFLLLLNIPDIIITNFKYNNPFSSFTNELFIKNK